MKKRLFLLLFLFTPLFGDELTVDPPVIWNANCPTCEPSPCAIPLPDPCVTDEITVDLLNPLYCEGVLSTEDGGILSGPGIRIQARKIRYTRLPEENPPVLSVECEGDLIIEYKGQILVGDSLFYDFNTQTGRLCGGKVAHPPWYLGGETIELCSNGDLIVHHGYITTSEGGERDVDLRTETIVLTREKFLTAENIQFRIGHVPVFWFPRLELDLSNIDDSPFAVTFGWGGFPGTHIGIRYQFLRWRDLKAYVRGDIFFGQGFGAGIETQYAPCDSNFEFYTRNYFATDLAIYDPHRRHRYRYQGTLFDRFWNETTTLNAIYDFVSDAEMAADYNTEDFELYTAERTQLELRRQDTNWIARFFTSVRVNDFQSINQELPSLTWSLHPFEVYDSGIIAEGFFQAAYFDYVFSDDVKESEHVSNFHSGRFEVNPHLYRPFYLGPITATPEASFIGIAYSNNQEGNAVGQAVGDLGFLIDTTLTRCYQSWKHVVEPYAHYHYLTAPRSNVDDHFIFTINDAYARLNLVRFGVEQSFFHKADCCIYRPLWIDLWANAFFDTKTIRETIPKAYYNLEWQPFSKILFSSDGAWNIEEHQADFYNFRLDWTFTVDFAMGVEYRHRSRFDWRKADFYNFILESVRTEEELLDSILSDRRDTFLYKVFYRFSPRWWSRFQLRHGWHRLDQPSYFEYKIELGTLLYQHWRLNFSYENRESDKRFAFTLKLDPGPPKLKCL